MTKSAAPDWLNPNRPPFTLSADQHATLAALSDTPAGEDARTMYLQQWHQAYCARHMQIVGVFGSLDPAVFTKRWDARFGDLVEARAAAATLTTPARKAA